jgi:hypothetical protein
MGLKIILMKRIKEVISPMLTSAPTPYQTIKASAELVSISTIAKYTP